MRNKYVQMKINFLKSEDSESRKLFLQIAHTFKILLSLLYFVVCPHVLPSFTHLLLPMPPSVSSSLSSPSWEAGSTDPV